MTVFAEAHTGAVQRRLLADGDHGPLPTPDAAQLVGMARDAGLTGRGGSGFPLWRKLNAVIASGRPPVIIANGAEGEPASGKDKALLAYQPHLVLDGLQLVARAARASTAHLYVPRPSALRAVLAARRDPIPVTLVAAPDAFVSGEESAVASAVAGRGAVPADKLTRLPDTGTLVQNVETLAHLAMIARYGAGWFRAAGTYDEPGTFLATVSGAVAAPGVLEAGYGVTLGSLIAAAGGPAGALSAVLVGGYHGAWVPADPELPISRAALAPFGASPGAGVVMALPSGACGLTENARIAGCLAGQSAGQCGPCVNGLPRLAATLADLAAFRSRPGLPAEVDRLTRLVTGRGACRHPDGTARLIASAMRAFSADVAAHLSGRCLATSGRFLTTEARA
ncbi:NADH-ubiquinone oxidoreductase-F iron-sulfur binding region domain-containing protein [Paractinoplanes atraurantiacus]|uniref:NADH:ubiquinone oxidoreductase, NADH-binding subunit (Chain F) n=1 Tax=Paractinoplanes atraurantiacus TaxID=1036182 RepID=A0A285J9D8_9ACTN|nr:NADH-ubiquinone oxidoreductase-F iron-sulfur binding region domain-containing protein [Actinoplanes atraurantiacus]SNY56915.1 NADH:ubiquinone oxidoreductase, NADH-binding subunit (chain F) [Actinoplanes atraurantiacus]